MTDDRRSARDAAIRAVLPLVPTQGWTSAAMIQASGPEADLLFPGGPPDMVAAYIDLADRDMVAEAGEVIAGQKVARRVRTLIATRLHQALPHKQAVRRAMGTLALPGNALTALRCTVGTVNAIWNAAGDTSTDISWYSKRAILAGVYGATLAYWLNPGRNQADTLAFLDRQLAGVAFIGKLRGGLTRQVAV